MSDAGARTQGELDEAEQKRRGALIRETLGLRQMIDYPDRVMTSGGSKTDLGLFRTILRIVAEGH